MALGRDWPAVKPGVVQRGAGMAVMVRLEPSIRGDGAGGVDDEAVGDGAGEVEWSVSGGSVDGAVTGDGYARRGRRCRWR